MPRTTSVAGRNETGGQPVGLVVEGPSEVGAIPVLLQNCEIRCCRPIHFGGQPVQCSLDKFRDFISLVIVPRVRAMILKRVSRVIVVIDRENRLECPGQFAQYIQQIIVDSIRTRYSLSVGPNVSVVCADRKLENWLITDPEGILTHNYIVQDLSRAVGNNADSKDAEKLIKRAFKKGRHYLKNIHARELAVRTRTMKKEVRRRSHSLDKLLRECGIAPIS
jgi:hypothetical protein